MAEEWRPIPSRPGYEASSAGRLRYGDTIIPGWVNGGGYRYVRLYRRPRPRVGARREIGMHVLVCEAFHGPKPSARHEVRHLDGDNQRNVADNLAWGTPSDNRRDSVLHGTNSICRYNEQRGR